MLSVKEIIDIESANIIADIEGKVARDKTIYYHTYYLDHIPDKENITYIIDSICMALDRYLRLNDYEGFICKRDTEIFICEKFDDAESEINE